MGNVVRLAKKMLEQALKQDVLDDLRGMVSAQGRDIVRIQELPGMRMATLEDRKELAEAYAFAVIRIMSAKPTAYTTENEGKVIREVRPMPAQLKEQSSHGAVLLPMHTDMTYLRFPTEDEHPEKSCAPDFLILICVEDSVGVPTTLQTLTPLLDECPGHERLREGAFSTRSPESVVPHREHRGVPLLFRHEIYGDMLRFDGNCSSLEGAAENDAALAELGVHLSARGTEASMLWSPGAALVFNNRRVLHGRGAIPADASVGQRHLKRVYAVRRTTPLNLASGHNRTLQQG